jgi:hypothetical protein
MNVKGGRREIMGKRGRKRKREKKGKELGPYHNHH